MLRDWRWLVSIITMVGFWIYSAGAFSERFKAMEQRLDRLEMQFKEANDAALVRFERLDRRNQDLELQLLKAVSRGVFESQSLDELPKSRAASR